MKILHTVEFYPPSIGGMQEVVKQLSERLVKLGHDVTVATTRLPERVKKIINGVKIAEFAISGNMVRGMEGELDKYRDYLVNSDFDIITNFAAQQWATDVMLPVLDRIKAKKVLVPTGFSALYQPEYQEYFEQMKTWLKKYDINVFLSENYRDINFAREYGVENIILIPNGAGKDEFFPEPRIDIRKKLGIPKDHFLVLNVGSHTGVKGHAEALEIFRRAKINKTTFLMIANRLQGGCKNKCELAERLYKYSLTGIIKNKQIIITELSRVETVAAYKSADVFLFPSNIECSPLVLFEAMASKTPFLTTDVGNAREIIEWSGGGKLLPTEPQPNGFVKADIDGSVRLLEELYNSPGLRETLARNGYEAWLDRFTWEKITLQYEELYKRLVAA